MGVIKQNSFTLSPSLDNNILKKKNGKISIKTKNKSQAYVKWTMIMLFMLTVLAFLTFDYKDIDLVKALSLTLANLKVMFFEPRISNFTFAAAMNAIMVTVALAFLTTIIGAVIALFGGLFAARNLSNKYVSDAIKGIVAIIRAIPTILWVLIFAVSVGLGSEAAIIGMTFHTVGYLIKAYSEAFEEIDYGVIEALKASGAGWWQIVFQAVLPSSVTYIAAWTFMRFEMNFANAVAVGAAAGAGGIGFELFMSSNFYFNVREVGFIAISILVVVVLLEMISTRVKLKYLK